MDYIAKMNRIEDWEEEHKLTLVEGWARDGLTDEQIANNMGIARSTFYNWRNKSKDIMDALKKGKEVVDYEVENALYTNAMNGNVTAQIFWLKNRKPNKWRDRVENANTVEEGKLDKIIDEFEKLAEE